LHSRVSFLEIQQRFSTIQKRNSKDQPNKAQFPAPLALSLIKIFNQDEALCILSLSKDRATYLHEKKFHRYG